MDATIIFTATIISAPTVKKKIWAYEEQNLGLGKKLEYNFNALSQVKAILTKLV